MKLLFTGTVCTMLTVACGTGPQLSASATPTPAPTATIRDIMDSMVDPSADVLWESVGTTFTESDVEERAPRTDDEWARLRRQAIQLVEAPALLLMPGRRVATPGAKSANPEVERSPDQIDAAIAADRQAFADLASGLRDTALPILRAIDTRDVKKLSDANGALDAACERC